MAMAMRSLPHTLARARIGNGFLCLSRTFIALYLFNVPRLAS
jgi:hypothetical protein